MADCNYFYLPFSILGVETGVWTKITTMGDGPSARFSVAGNCLDPYKVGTLALLGGCNRSLEALDDMYYLFTGLYSCYFLEQRMIIIILLMWTFLG